MMERWGVMAWQAGMVFTLRSLELWSEPLDAAPRLMSHMAEKQRALLQGMVGMTAAAARGAAPLVMVEAALEPARKRVAANARGLAMRRPA